MKKLLIVIYVLAVSFGALIFIGYRRTSEEFYYYLPQAKSYVYKEDRKMNFEIYSNSDDSIIRYVENNEYRIKSNDETYILTNVSVDMVKQENIYLYIIEADVLNLPYELFEFIDAQLEISNSKFILKFKIDFLSILNPNTIELISINDLFGSYSYVNGSLELVGLNIKFGDNYRKLDRISVGNYTVSNLTFVLDYMLDNEINILDSIPNYNIINNENNGSLIISDSSFFIPLNYPKLLNITEGYILFEIDEKLYYFDTFSFIVNDLLYFDYKDKMKLVEIKYDNN